MSGAKDSWDFWLLKCKKQIVSSPEWKEFLTDLEEKVQQLKFKSHVSCFVDLSRPEKLLLVEQAAKNVDQRFTCALHHQISATIKPILNDYAIVTSTKENFVISDIMIDLIYDWVSSIIKQWPHLKNKLGIFFNQPLQEKLRQLTWNCFLHTNQVFSDYPKPDEKFNPPKQLENVIARNCKQILHEINMKSLNNSTSAFKAMRAMVFSYCSTTGVTSLAIEDFLLTIPFLLSISPFPGELSKKMLTVLVEEYLGFMMNRPSFMLESDTDFKMFVEMILQLLMQKYPTTVQTFSDALSCSGIGTEITDSLTEKFMVLLKPVIQGMLVVYLNPEALLYAWDQFLICGQVPGLSGHWLQVVIVISLHFLRNYIHLTSDISSMLLEKWPHIRMSEIQYEVQKSFQEDFQSLQEGLHLPTCDSSSDIGWFSYSLVPPTPPEVKRANEEKQNIEKKRYVQELLQKKEDETKKQIESIRDHFTEKSDYIEKEMERMKEENMELHRKLKEEQEAQVFLKHESEEQISALKVEISWLKLQVPQLTPGISTPTETCTLPPQSQDTMAEVPTSRSSFTRTRRSVVKQFIRNYQNKIKSAIIPTSALFMGEELAEIKSHIQDDIDNIKKTELKLFQRRLRAGEINHMPPDIQQKTYESILSKMEERLLEKEKKKSAYRA